MSLIVGLAYHKNTNAKVEQACSVIGDMLSQPWAPTGTRRRLGPAAAPSAHQRLPLSAPHRIASAPPARRMRELELTVRERLTAAQHERKAKLNAGRAG